MSKETELITLLREAGLTIATAESLTGGLTAATLVSVPGASNAFMEGFITYDIGAKHRTLGISQELLDRVGAVAAETAHEMCLGAADRAGTDVAIATTGNAGPDPSEGKPVGLVYTGVNICGNVTVREHHFSGTRPEIRQKTVEAAIEDCYALLKDYLEKP